MKPQEYLMNEMFDKRCALGISQAEMANKLEIGKSLCSMKTLAMFLEYSGVDKDEFISGLVETFEESE